MAMEGTGKDGGPAFPGGSLRFDDGDCATPYQIGMSLRDWFAGQALIAMGATRSWSCDRGDDMTMLAEQAFVIADAMLTARAVEA
jgi:hypothetical protein